MPAKAVMKLFRQHKLHSGSPKGPIVTNPHQAKAIQISYARKEGAHIPKPPNFTTPDSSYVPAGATGEWTKGSGKVPYKQVAEAGSVTDGAKKDRAVLNLQRDKRTNLGKGLPAIIEVE